MTLAKPVEVLLVEDNVGDILMVKQAVAREQPPVSIHVAVDGEQAMWIMTRTEFHADVVILDLNIPKISGFSLLQRIRPAMPVVVFTSSSRPYDREHSLELGAREVIQKPHDLDDYTQVVRQIVRKWGVGGVEAAE